MFVLLFHVTSLINAQLNYEYMNKLFRFGYMGVDLFFVLSGFIISYIHRADFGTMTKSKTFFVKRFTRIFPVYWMMLIPVVIVHFVIPSFGHGNERNIVEIVQSIFLIPQNHHPILDAAWTLRHEMFFYIMFGLLFIINRNAVIFSMVLATWAGMSIYSLLFKVHNPWFLFDFLFSPFNLEFLLGCLVTFVLTKYKINFKIAWASIIFGFGLFLFSLLNEFFAYYEVVRVINWGIPSALILLGAVAIEVKSKIHANKIFAYLGDASYSIYLTHVPAIYFIITIFNKLNIFSGVGYFPTATLCIVLVLACGCVFYQVIEKPVLKLCKRAFLKEQTNSWERIASRNIKSV